MKELPGDLFDMSIAAACAKYGVSKATVCLWRKRLKSEIQSQGGTVVVRPFRKPTEPPPICDGCGGRPSNGRRVGSLRLCSGCNYRGVGMDRCVVETCRNGQYRDNLCGKHFQARQKTLGTSPKDGSPIKELWDRAIAGGSGCITHGSVRGSLYGRVCVAAHGPRPNGMEVAHSCGNALCCNADHLRWATHVDNVSDRYAHGTIKWGADNPLNKRPGGVTPRDILDMSIKQAMSKYAVSESTILNWKKRLRHESQILVP